MSAYVDAPVPLVRPLAPYPLRPYRPEPVVEPPLILLEGPEKIGKAQPLHARIATPTGWTTMGAIAPGHRVLGANGRPTTVTAVHERGERDIYRLTFSDGVQVEACDEHLWLTWTSDELHNRYKNGPNKGERNPRPKVRTTADLRELVLNGTVVHIPVTGPVEYDDLPEPLPLNPYALGLLLGDGGLTKQHWPVFTSGDPELFDALADVLPEGDTLTRHRNGTSAGIKGGHTAAVLREAGLLGVGSATKFAPWRYLRATVIERLALLQGLLDTDGGMESKSIRYTTVSVQLANQVRELVQSLGGTCRMTTKEPSYTDAQGERKQGKTAYMLTVRLPIGMCPFGLTRKVERWREVRPTFHTPPRRTVRAVEHAGTMPVRCITVDAEDHLYLTDHFVVTHNSWLTAEFTGDERICHTWWIEWGEKPCAAEYLAIPGADYEIVPHDGTFWAVLSLVEQISVQARELISREGAPLLVVDTASAEWEALKNLAHARTMASPAVLRKIAADPAARADKHTIHTNTWNDVTDLHYELMRLLQRFPGIVVLTARGKEVTAFDEDGKPIPGERTYRVDGHKNIGYDASAWVRMTRERGHHVIASRSVRAPLRPGIDEPRPFRSLASLVFEVLAYEPRPWEPNLHEEEVRQLAAGEPRPVEIDWDARLDEANALDIPGDRKAALAELWNAAMFQRQQFGTVAATLIARIEQAGHQAAEALRIEVSQAWDDAHPDSNPAEPPGPPTATGGVSGQTDGGEAVQE